MAEDLKAIREAWEKRDARGQRSSSGKASLEDDDKVRKLADKYVAAHKDDFAGFDNLSLDALVKTLESLPRERRRRGPVEDPDLAVPSL
jgi:hypothetical protein